MGGFVWRLGRLAWGRRRRRAFQDHSGTRRRLFWRLWWHTPVRW